MSIHIAADKGAIADRILLPGDPLRAQFIAENYLENPVCYNRVRGMLGFTGTYKGKRLSVQGTGMGIPSISIYVNELLREYGVKRLMRVGTCGSLQAEVKLRDVVIASSACTDSNVNRLRFSGMDYAPAASFTMARAAYDTAISHGISPHVGAVLSSDSFYTDDPDQWKLWAMYNVVAVEMESAELYTLAAKYRAEALAILTVSDSLISHEITSSEEREKTFKAMMEIALDII
jgi:purine-nucleoside phosphorylase